MAFFVLFGLAFLFLFWLNTVTDYSAHTPLLLFFNIPSNKYRRTHIKEYIWRYTYRGKLTIHRRSYTEFFIFFLIRLKLLCQLVRRIYGLMLLYRSILLISYIIGPYHASIAAGTPFSALSKRWCLLPEPYGLLIKCNRLELVNQLKRLHKLRSFLSKFWLG